MPNGLRHKSVAAVVLVGVVAEVEEVGEVEVAVEDGLVVADDRCHVHLDSNPLVVHLQAELSWTYMHKTGSVWLLDRPSLVGSCPTHLPLPRPPLPPPRLPAKPLTLRSYSFSRPNPASAILR